MADVNVLFAGQSDEWTINIVAIPWNATSAISVAALLRSRIQEDELSNSRIAYRLAAFLAAFGFSTVLASAPAVAETQHSVDLVQVCKENYKQPTAKVKRLDWKFDPYSFYCYMEVHSNSLGLPPTAGHSVTEQPLGDLDVQAYCNKHHPGSRATGRMFLTEPYWTCDEG